jgi:hypothetical protein
MAPDSLGDVLASAVRGERRPEVEGSQTLLYCLSDITGMLSVLRAEAGWKTGEKEVVSCSRDT